MTRNDHSIQEPTPAGRCRMTAHMASGATWQGAWRHRLAWILAVCGFVLSMVSLNSALGFGVSVVPFASFEPVPRDVVLDFRSLSRQAPPHMDPRAIADQARKVAVGDFGSQERTLYIAPTENGGFCYQWTPAYGGCSARSHRISAWGSLIVPEGTNAEATASPGNRAAFSTAVREMRQRSASRWLVGYSLDLGAAVVIRFSDGTEIEPTVVKVGQPIEASFFFYEVPPEKRTATVKAVVVQAIDDHHNVVGEQQIR